MAEPLPEGLALWGSFGQNRYSAPEHMGPNTVFMNDSAVVCARGDWRPEELRIVRNRLGAVVLYGNCLADMTEIDGAVSAALEGDNPQVLTTLPGSYTALLFGRDKLTVFADLANQFPFYYRQDGRKVQFSSMARRLQSANGECRPDRLTLAADMAITVPSDLLAGRSAIDGVFQLEGGHMLEATVQGSAHVSAYETFQVPSVFNLHEGAELLRAALQDALRRRAALGYPMSADVSGGLDSTSAARLLAYELSQPLLVTTYYSADVPSDDLAHARRYLALPESQGLFDAREFEHPAALTAYAELTEALVRDVPDLSIISLGRDRAYYQFLRDQGSKIHITGSGADTLLDMAPRMYLGGLARPRTYGRFIRSIFEAARSEARSPLGLFQDIRIQQELDPASKLRIISRLLRGGPSPEALRYDRDWIFGAGAMPEWLTPWARRELSELALTRAGEICISPAYDSGNYNAYAELKCIGAGLQGAMHYATQFGIRKHAVYMDSDVVRACFGLPAHVRVNPWIFKTLLVHALDGLVPREVTSRATKGDYSIHALKGLRAAHAAVSRLLKESRLADLGIIDPQAIRRTLDSVVMGANPPWASLNQFIVTELWLRNTEAGKGVDGVTPAHMPTATIRKSENILADASRYGMPPGIVMTTRDTGGVVVNVPNGTYHRLNTAALHVLEALRDTASFHEAISVLETRYPTIPRTELQGSASRLIRQLVTEGVLVEGADTFAIFKGTHAANRGSSVTMTRQGAGPAKAHMRDYVVAASGLAAALAVSRAPFARQVEVVSALHRRWCRRPASEAEASSLLAAVQRVSVPYLGRVACLEATLATVFAAALRRQKVNLVLGVKTDPDKFHAWPEADGIPIRTARDPEIVGIFEPIFKV